MKAKASQDWSNARRDRTAGGVFDRAKLVEKLKEGPPKTPESQGPQLSRWTLKTIRESIEMVKAYTLSGLWHLLKRARVIWRTTYLRQWSPDPEYLSKRELLCAHLREAGGSPGQIELIFMDEAGFYRWPAPAKTWAQAAPCPPPCAYHEGEDNNTQWRIIAGMNAYSGRVTYLTNYIVGRKQVIEWYQRLADAYPQAQKIYVAQDNWSIHTHLDVLEALKQHPRIEPLWLPTYSPWLNPIEKMWRWLKVDYLKMHRLSQDWKELRRQVGLFLDQFCTESRELLRYVGLLGDGLLARALRCQ